MTTYETHFDDETYRIRVDFSDPTSPVLGEGEEPGEWEVTCWGQQSGHYGGDPTMAMHDYIECVMAANEIDPYGEGNEALLKSIGSAAGNTKAIDEAKV